MLKKTFAFTALASTILLGSVPTYASDIKISGDYTTKYFTAKQEDTDRDSTLVNTFKIQIDAPLSGATSFYTRIGGQSLANNIDDFKDFNPDAYENSDAAIAFDQFGLKFQQGNFNFKLGRQDLLIGQTALLYSRSGSNIGKHNFVDALTFSGLAGQLDINGVIAKEDSIEDDSKLQALRFGQTVNDNLSYGLTLAHYQPYEGDNTNHWAVDASYTTGSCTFFTEYTKSNADSLNTAYAFGWEYSFNDKTSFAVTRFKVDENGDMGGQSDFDNGNAGFHYTLAQQLDETVSLELVYKNQKEISTSIKNNSLEASVSFAF